MLYFFRNLKIVWGISTLSYIWLYYFYRRSEDWEWYNYDQFFSLYTHLTDRCASIKISLEICSTVKVLVFLFTWRSTCDIGFRRRRTEYPLRRTTANNANLPSMNYVSSLETALLLRSRYWIRGKAHTALSYAFHNLDTDSWSLDLIITV